MFICPFNWVGNDLIDYDEVCNKKVEFGYTFIYFEMYICTHIHIHTHIILFPVKWLASH